MAENPNEFTAFDVSFILRPARVLINAVTALAEPSLNPKNQAVIEVGKGGFEITVRAVDTMSSREVFEFLCLKASGLQDFQCNKPMRKIVSLKSLIRAFKGVSSLDCSNIPMSIYVDYGSNEFYFVLDGATSDFGLGLPVSIKLNDLESEYGKFPDVTYGTEAVIPSVMLTDKIPKLLKRPPGPYDCFHSSSLPYLFLYETATVVFKLATQDMKQDKESGTSFNELSMYWEYWGSLDKALRMADKFSLHLVKNPPQYVMFRINLGEVGDFVYLSPAEFLNVAKLGNLGQFQSLLR